MVILLIIHSKASLIFFPSLAEILKLPQNPFFSANSFNSLLSLSLSSSKRSTLLSTKMQGIFPPSIKSAFSSTAAFHLKVLYYKNIIIYLNKTYSSLVCLFVASDIITHP